MQNFQDFSLRSELLRALDKINFAVPTPIQAATIPVALEGKDIIGSAQTGTGKTGAFGIPLIAHLLNNSQDNALVLTPTRELATQVMDMLRKMLTHSEGIRAALLIGGQPMPKQLQQLKAHPRLIVGTPGRINDHLDRGTLKLGKTRFLVLDETDRMLDMGFGIQIDQILTHMPQSRQTLLFSATLPHNIMKLSSKFLTEPVRISTAAPSAPAADVQQETIQLAETHKYDQLVSELQQREGSIIVFVKTKMGADRMAKKLRTLNHTVGAVHGDLKQSQRDRAIRAFRNRENRIMVATDVAARGLDIPHIEHVINYDLPQSPEDYIHRIGRTARAGAKGSAVNLVTPQDRKKWQAIDRLLNPGKKPEGRQADERRGEGKKFVGRKFAGKKFEGKGGSEKKADGKRSGFPGQARKSPSSKPSHRRSFAKKSSGRA